GVEQRLEERHVEAVRRLRPVEPDVGHGVVEVDEDGPRLDEGGVHGFLPVKAAMAAAPASLMMWSTTSARSQASPSASGSSRPRTSRRLARARASGEREASRAASARAAVSSSAAGTAW